MTATTPRPRLRPTSKVLPEHARAHNRSTVLQSLFHSGPSSRADLARETGLTRVTVSDLVAELLEEELVEDLGLRPEARVGKPATPAGLRAVPAQALAIDLSDDSSAISAVVDLAGGLVRRRAVAMRRRSGEAA